MPSFSNPASTTPEPTTSVSLPRRRMSLPAAATLEVVSGTLPTEVNTMFDAAVGSGSATVEVKSNSPETRGQLDTDEQVRPQSADSTDRKLPAASANVLVPLKGNDGESTDNITGGAHKDYIGYIKPANPSNVAATAPGLELPQALVWVPVCEESRKSMVVICRKLAAVGEFQDTYHFLPSYKIAIDDYVGYSEAEKLRIKEKAHETYSDMANNFNAALDHLRVWTHLPTHWYTEAKLILDEYEALEARNAAVAEDKFEARIAAAVAENAARMQTLEARVGALEEENCFLKEMRGQEANDIDSLRQMLKAAQKEKEEALAEAGSKHSTQIEAVRGELATLKAEQKTLRDSSDAKDATLTDRRKAGAELQATIARLEATAKSKAAQHDQTKQELTNIREQLSRSKATSLLRRKDIHKLQVKLNKLEFDLKTKVAQVPKLEGNLKVVREERYELMTESRNLLQANKALKEEILVLQKGYGIVDYLKT